MSLAERLARTEPDKLAELRERVQVQLVEVLGPKLYDTTISDRELQEMVHGRLREILDLEPSLISGQEKAQLIRQIGDSVLGLGPLEPFVRDPDITEVAGSTKRAPTSTPGSPTDPG